MLEEVFINASSFEMFHVNFYEHVQPSEILHFHQDVFLGFHSVPVLIAPPDSPWLPLFPHNSPPNSLTHFLAIFVSNALLLFN